MPETMLYDCTVLVSSFDGFADCWEVFDYGMEKYWPDCPWPIVLLTGSKMPEFRRVRALPLGEDRGWAGNMIAALRQIRTRYVLYLQEDYWLTRKVDTPVMESYLRLMSERKWQYLRLNPSPPPGIAVPDHVELGICPSDEKYRICLQVALWDREFLSSLLFDGESGWDFERYGRERASGIGDGVVSVFSEKDGIAYCGGTAVRKGRWTLGAIRYAEKEGLNIDFSSRKRESRLEDVLNAIGKPLPAKILARAGLRTLQILRKERSLFDFFQ